MTNILDNYVLTAPTPTNAIDIFRGEWASKLPFDVAEGHDGTAFLFSDPRITWSLALLGDVKGKTVLDLGSLEGGHAYMLERAGAHVLGIEANTRAFLRCLIVKNLLGLQADFACGDFVEYLRGTPRAFDIVLANGVLYHMVDPVELIDRISRVTSTLIVWTHYHDADADALKRDPVGVLHTHNGFAHVLYPFPYGEALTTTPGYCGGTAAYANRLSRTDLLGALRHFGFTRIDIEFDHAWHPNGPAFALTCRKD